MEKPELEKIIQEGIKEAHFAGLQSGKQETSGLATDILRKMKDEVAESVRIQINGKLKAISAILEEQTLTMNEHFDKSNTHMDKDKEWKDTYTPYIKGLASISDGGKIMV